MTRAVLSRLDKHRIPLVPLFAVALGVLAGGLCAFNALLGLIVIGAGVVIVVLDLLFFKNGRLSLDRIVIPLLIVAVLCPGIRLLNGVPAVRLELVIIVIAWLLLLLGSLSAGTALRLRWNPTNKWFLLFGLVILVSIACAAFVRRYYPIGRDFWEFAKLIEYFLIFALVSSLRVPAERIGRYYVIALLVFLVSAAVGFAQYVNLFNINSIVTPYYAPTQLAGVVKAGRIVGTAGNPNAFGALMVLPASLALTGAVWLESRRIRLASWGAFLLFVLAIVLTLSRSAVLSLGVACCFILFFKYLASFGLARTIRMLCFALPALLVLVLIVIQLAPETFFSRLGGLTNLSAATSWQARLAIWNDQLAVWRQSPFVSWGPGKITMATTIDSEWLLLLRRYGALGVAVFILWFIGIYRTLSRVSRDNTNPYTKTLCVALQATLLAYAVFMIPAGVYHNLHLMPILLLFLGVAYSQRSPSTEVSEACNREY